jgi:hypothetical protein
MTEAASAARGGGDGPPTARADGARDQPEEDPLQCWTTERDRIYEQVTSRGWNAQSRAFVQHYHTDVLDFAPLRMPGVGSSPHEFLCGPQPWTRWTPIWSLMPTTSACTPRRSR